MRLTFAGPTVDAGAVGQARRPPLPKLRTVILALNLAAVAATKKPPLCGGGSTRTRLVGSGPV